MKKSIFAILTFFLIVFSAFPQSDIYANRNSALKYLKLAQDYVLKSQWENALSTAEIGLTYDSSLADLWYVKSLAQYQKQEKNYLVIENLEKSLINEWVSYNPSGAKIFLSNFYYATMEYEKALNLLSDRSLLLNSDALKISSKIYYITGNVQKARELLDTAWRMFPTDVDFPLIFYRFENSVNVGKSPTNASEEIFSELNETFLSLSFDYIDGKNRVNPEFLLLASSFADDELQEKLLKVYKTQGIESPLYPIKALEAGLISEDEAISSFFSLSNNKIQYNFLHQLFNIISPEKYPIVYSILDSFQGRLYFDKNNDGFFELYSDYKNGRPIFAVYEQKQDGILTWNSSFDYGTPRKVFVPSEELTLTYARYPYISRVETNDLDFSLIPDSLKWLPFEVVPASFSSKEYDFYVLNPIDEKFDSSMIYKKSSSVVTYLTNKNQIGEEKIRFLLTEGEIVSGNYYLDNKLYASSVFENGKMIFRNLDKDLNGTFEVTEIYSSDFPENSELAENVIYEDIFGAFPYDKKLWLSSICVDLNDDSVTDYSESYNFDGSITKKWGLVEENRDKDKNLQTLVFSIPLSERKVEVNFVDGLPAYFLYNNLIYPIKYDKENDFYWLGDIPFYSDTLDYQQIKQDLLDKKTVYAVEIYKFDDNNYYYAAKTFGFYFAQQM